MPREDTFVPAHMVSNLGSIDLDKLRTCHHEGRPTTSRAVQKSAYSRYGKIA